MNSVPRPDAVRKFAHILHFKCPKCGKRMKAVRANESMSREHIARLIFHPTCSCGWTGQLAGFNAIQHAVECWTGQTTENPAVHDAVETQPKPGSPRTP